MRRCFGITPPRPHQRRQQRLVAALSSAETSSTTHDQCVWEADADSSTGDELAERTGDNFALTFMAGDSWGQGAQLEEEVTVVVVLSCTDPDHRVYPRLDNSLSPMTSQQRQQQQRAMEESGCDEAAKQWQLQQERNNAQYRLERVAMRKQQREWELSEVQRLFEESVQRVVVEQGKICCEEQLQKQLGAGAAGPEDPKGPNQPSTWQAWWQALLCPSGGGGCGGSHAAACP